MASPFGPSSGVPSAPTASPSLRHLPHQPNPSLTLDARRQRPKRKPRVGKPHAQPLQIELAFSKRIAALFERLAAKAVAVATARVGRLTLDAVDDERASIARALEEEVDFGPEEAAALVGAVAVHNARQMQRSLRPANDAEVPSSRPSRRASRLRVIRPGDEPEPLGLKIPELSRSNVRRHARRTVREIKGITREVAARIAPVVTQAASQGLRAEVLAQELQRRLELSKKSALRRAIEQVIRINSAITRERHEKLGITEYDWHAVDDQHTRRWHRKLHRTRQRYDSPPMGGGGGPKDRGHPGSADVCRCQAIPVIP
jgi:SPP1 gp7 family putative phage head morphogenesis protein